MGNSKLSGTLNMKNGFLSIKRVSMAAVEAYTEKGCTLKMLHRAFAGETLYLNTENITCNGAAAGFGFVDGLPNIPGGFGHFISYGRGKGFPPGERVKCSPEVGETMFLNQPKGVMDGFDAVCIKPYEPGEGADIVSALVTPDQLSALIHIFCFRKAGYDNVIVPMASGCASVFRIPFGELKREEPRAVIGNIDVFSRPHFEKDMFFFTVSGKDFETMLTDTNECVITASIWKGIQARL